MSANAIESPTRVWVATQNGNVYRTDFSGGTWHAVVPVTVPAAGYISDLLVVPGTPTQMWVTFSSPQPTPVMRSQDGALTFERAGSAPTGEGSAR